jgi:hypothetical protein
MTDIITRADALSKGLRTFWTAEPCKRGHVAERYVSDRGCVECKRRGRKPTITRPCARCGEAFSPDKFTPAQKFCSPSCSRKAQHAVRMEDPANRARYQAQDVDRWRKKRGKLPPRTPEPTEDGTPWHLRDDLTWIEVVNTLSPEEQSERTAHRLRASQAKFKVIASV